MLTQDSPLPFIDILSYVLYNIPLLTRRKLQVHQRPLLIQSLQEHKERHFGRHLSQRPRNYLTGVVVFHRYPVLGNELDLCLSESPRNSSISIVSNSRAHPSVLKGWTEMRGGPCVR